jgi:hypothetical protein
MKTPSEPPKPKEAQAGAPRTTRHPILPTVFMRSSVLQEQLRGIIAPELVNSSFSTLSDDLVKKSGALRECLHELRYAPARVSPHTIQEAETVLIQADCLLAALPSYSSTVHPDVSKERLCRAVDMTLMLDAAIRALQSP